MTRLALSAVLAVLLTTSCSRADAPRPVSQIATAPASSPSAPATPAPPPPPPPGANAEQVALARSICEAAFARDAGGSVAVGCLRAPPYGLATTSGPLPEHTGDRRELCAFQRVYHGAFTKPGAKEIVVAIDNCFFDSGGNAPGRAILVEEDGGRYRYVSLVPDVNAARCQVGHLAGERDVLVCEDTLGGMGVGLLHFFFQLDLERADKRAKLLADVYENHDTLPCYALTPDAPFLPAGLVAIDVIAMKATDGGFAVELDRRRAPPTPALEAKARALCTGAPTVEPQPLDPLLPKKTRFRLDLAKGAEGFAPTPVTTAQLRAWEKEQPAPSVLRTSSPVAAMR